MINLSNYHSNGLPTAVWSNKVNLIGEKVYKPKLHFCERCNKPILIYGRLIPCKHVFCFTCATLCLTQNRSNSLAQSPPQPHNSESNHHHHNQVASPHEPPLPPPPNHHYHQSPLAHHHNNNNNNSTHGNSIKSYNDQHPHNHYYQRERRRTPTRHNNHSSGGNNSKNLDLHRSDSNHSYSSRDNNERQQQHASILNLDESTNHTTPTTIQQDMSIDSPSLNGAEGTPTGASKGSGSSGNGKGCHRCGGRALRVERNTLNSIFVCQVETCRRTYLSARDLQAHVNHRHSRNKMGHSSKNPSGSLAAISSSPYISSSTLMHLNNQHHSSTSRSHNEHHSHQDHHGIGGGGSNSRRHMSNNGNNSNKSPANNYPNSHHPHQHNRHDRDGPPPRHGRGDRFRERDNYQRDRDRDRQDNKEYHRQSLQRAAQWAEQSAQMMEKGLTR